MGAEVVASYSRSLLSKKGTPKQRQHPAYNNRKAHLAPQARPEREARMVWAITLAVFLGIAVVAVLLFFIYSRAEQIRKALKEKRAEKRIPTELEVELSSPDELILYEKCFSENASHYGARIISRKQWQRHDRVLVRLPQKAKPSRARVAYCTALTSDAFAVGLHFSSAVGDWLISDDEGSTQ
jgi:hypothetical protein